MARKVLALALVAVVIVTVLMLAKQHFGHPFVVTRQVVQGPGGCSDKRLVVMRYPKLFFPQARVFILTAYVSFEGEHLGFREDVRVAQGSDEYTVQTCAWEAA